MKTIKRKEKSSSMFDKKYEELSNFEKNIEELFGFDDRIEKFDNKFFDINDYFYENKPKQEP